MSNTIKAICTSCQGSNLLSQEDLSKLENSELVSCSECGTLVKIKADPGSERKAMMSALTLIIGAVIVCIVALINIFGDAGFPTYYVAIPFILVSSLMVTSQSNNVLELQRVE